MLQCLRGRASSEGKWFPWLAKPVSDIPFHRVFWRAEDAACHRQHDGAARARFAEFLRSYLAIEPSASVNLVGSGRVALRLGLAALTRFAPGRKKVVVPSYCCTAVVPPVVDSGLVPVFIDTGPQLISEPDQYIRALADDVLAVLMVNLCGKRLSDPERARVLAQCRARGIFVIEDNCHYLVPSGVEPRADMEMHSFGYGKVLSATAGGALIARVAGAEIEAELQRYAVEPLATAIDRFNYFMVRYGEGAIPAAVEAAYQQARTQYDPVLMNEFDAALALAYAPRLDATVRRQIKISKQLLRELARRPQTYSTPGPDDNIFTRLPVALADVEAFGRFWSWMAAAKIELEGMYLPLHLKFPELHDGTPLPYAEQVYGRVFNVPNRANLDFFEVRRIRRLLDGFDRSAK